MLIERHKINDESPIYRPYPFVSICYSDLFVVQMSDFILVYYNSRFIIFFICINLENKAQYLL